MLDGKGQEADALAAAEPRADYDGRQHEFVHVDRARVAVSAGHGHLVFFEESDASLAFRSDFLRSRNLIAKDLVVVDVKGSSMEPTITDGAVLLVNRAEKEIVPNRVYAFRLDGELLVKRLRRRGEMLVATSDNPAYPDVTIKTETSPDFEIIGRAVWMGGSL